MARRPRPLRGTSLTARVMNLACRRKAERLGIDEYSVARLCHDAGLHHSIISRAVAPSPKKGPTRETVMKLAETLEVALDGALEDSFWNAFGYASPRQMAAAQSHVDQAERRESEESQAGDGA
jgi:hypothetical protein